MRYRLGPVCSTVPWETLITHPPLPSRSFEIDSVGREAFPVAFRWESKGINPDGKLSSLLASSEERRDFDRFLHKDRDVDDCGGFERLFSWKYGTRDMKSYFDEMKTTARYRKIRSDLENSNKCAKD
jgi:hypothetical protein